MNVYISADMEGTAGVVSWDEVLPSRPLYSRGRHLMVREVNAAVEGAIEGGAALIVVNDSHDGQRNLEPEELHPAAQLLSGRPKRFGMVAGAEGQDFDVALFTGYHAAAGTTGVLAHTWTAGLTAVRLNGEIASETRFNAALLGEWGIPVGLVSGDEILEEDVRSFLPGAEFVAVKKPFGAQAGLSLPPSVAREQIRNAASQAVRRARDLAPYRLTGPIEVEVSFAAAPSADGAEILPRSHRVDPYRVAYVADGIEEAYMAMRTLTALGAI